MRIGEDVVWHGRQYPVRPVPYPVGGDRQANERGRPEVRGALSEPHDDLLARLLGRWSPRLSGPASAIPEDRRVRMVTPLP
jgi:hypothetical protein